MRKYSDDQFISAIMSSKTLVEVRVKLNLSKHYDHRFLKTDIDRLEIDTSHLRKGKHRFYQTDELSIIFCVNSGYTNNGHLKMRLFKEALKVKQCEICHIIDWNDKPLNFLCII